MSGSKQDSAQALARRGFRIFPLPEGEKAPPPKRFYENTIEPSEIDEFFWGDNNIGVLTGDTMPDGRQLHVLDVDIRSGGFATLAEFELMGLDTNTFRVATPSGGAHLYYGCPTHWPQLSNSAGKLGPGLDTRGYHGYVVGPGSTTPAGEYRVAFDGPVLTLPEWMLEHLKPRRALGDNGDTWLVTPDDPGMVERAIAHAQRFRIPPEGHRNDTMVMLALDLRDMGISLDRAIAIGLEHWPLLDLDLDLHDEWAKTAASAYRSAQRPAGTLTPAAQFESLDIDPTAEIKAALAERKARFRIDTIPDLRALPDTQWLVGGWFQEGASGILYGKWGSGKSFLVFDLAMHLAIGKPDWHGAALPGVPCPVLIIASEGKSGFLGRIDAFKTMHGVADDPTGLHFMRASVNLMQERDFKALADVIAETGVQYRMIMIDTVGRTLAGVDTNTQESISMFMSRARDLGALTGATVVGVHHENKSGTMLGSIVFENDSDFIFQVEKKSPDAPLSEVEIHCRKLKEGKDGWSVSGSFMEVEIDDRGVGSLVVNNIGTKTVVPTGGAGEGGGVVVVKGRGYVPPPVETCQAYLDGLQAAWDAGTPWNESPRSKATGLNIYANADRILGMGHRRLVDTWLGSIIVKDQMKAGPVRREGFKVVGTL